MEPMGDVHVQGGAATMSFDELRARIVRYLERTDVEKAIVFGSWARGQQDGMSDLDLVLVERTDRPFVERGLAHLELFRMGVGVDLIVYTPDEYRRLLEEGRPFVEQIESEGVVIHARSVE
jgi:predicted nucleotidyltransferase